MTSQAPRPDTPEARTSTTASHPVGCFRRDRLRYHTSHLLADLADHLGMLDPDTEDEHEPEWAEAKTRLIAQLTARSVKVSR